MEIVEIKIREREGVAAVEGKFPEGYKSLFWKCISAASWEITSTFLPPLAENGMNEIDKVQIFIFFLIFVEEKLHSLMKFNTSSTLRMFNIALSGVEWSIVVNHPKMLFIIFCLV